MTSQRRYWRDVAIGFEQQIMDTRMGLPCPFRSVVIYSISLQRKAGNNLWETNFDG